MNAQKALTATAEATKVDHFDQLARKMEQDERLVEAKDELKAVEALLEFFEDMSSEFLIEETNAAYYRSKDLIREIDSRKSIPPSTDPF